MFDDFAALYSYSIGDFSFDKVLAVPIAIRRITTKTGKRMAFVYMSDGKEVRKITVFAQTWAKVEKLLHEFTPVCIRLSYLDDGGLTINPDGIIDAKELLQMQQERIGQ